MLYRIVSASLLIVGIATCTSCGRTEPASEAAPTRATARTPNPGSLDLDANKDWKPCAVMPAGLAGKAIGVPASQMKSHEFGKTCMHERVDGSESTEAYAQLGALDVFETVQSARARFEEDNSQARQDAADQIMDALAGGVTYQPVDNVGDDAAMNLQNGQLHVLAWSGPTIGDRSAPSTEAIKDARREHLSKNWDKQKQLQAELASSIIDLLGSR